MMKRFSLRTYNLLELFTRTFVNTGIIIVFIYFPGQTTSILIKVVGVVGGLVFIAVVALIIVIIVVVCCLVNNSQKEKKDKNGAQSLTYGITANTAYLANSRDHNRVNCPDNDITNQRRCSTVSQQSTDIYYDYVINSIISPNDVRRPHLLQDDNYPTSLESIIQDNVAYNSPQEVKSMQKILAEKDYVHDLM